MTYEAFYKACKEVARDLGPDIKNMSWFMRNARTQEQELPVARAEVKEAA